MLMLVPSVYNNDRQLFNKSPNKVKNKQVKKTKKKQEKKVKKQVKFDWLTLRMENELEFVQ